MGLWNGNINIEERLLSALKITGNKITIKLLENKMVLLILKVKKKLEVHLV